ncbi:MAG: hypothetical protein HOH33_08695 [Verrucomicrobia bacterium]|jgi:hypothetical protein|nr:hypothetical protein [Verrucomicrobiota bacterium]
MNPKPPIFIRIFFGLFGMIGLTILAFMWGTPTNAFGAPPLFFRIFASFIALAFITLGFGTAFSLSSKFQRFGMANRPSPQEPTSNESGYACPHCAAGLDKQEVSPSGDVKCGYCSKWYNIHHG